MDFRFDMMNGGSMSRIAHIFSMAASQVDAPIVQSTGGRMACYFTDHQVSRFVSKIYAVARAEKVQGNILKPLVDVIGASESLVIFQELNNLVLVNEHDGEKFEFYRSVFAKLSEYEELAEPWWRTISDNISPTTNRAEQASAS